MRVFSPLFLTLFFFVVEYETAFSRLQTSAIYHSSHFWSIFVAPSHRFAKS
jgi:hypothetical protein